MKASDLKFAVHAHPTLAEVVDEVFKQVETYA
jgi:dihydrolipoamide dehydrogenase